MTKNVIVDFWEYSVTKDSSQKVEYTITKDKIIGYSPIIGKNTIERTIRNVVSSKDEDGADVLVFQTTVGKNGVNEYIILIHQKEGQKDKFVLKTPMFDAKTGDIFGYIIEEN